MPNTRKPTHLKLVTGNAGKRPLPENEPQLPAGAPPIPAHLTPRGRAAWRRFMKLLDDMGVMTRADGPAAERMCECYGEILAARESYERPMMSQRRNPETGEIVETQIAAGGEPTYVSYGKDGAMLRSRPELALMAELDRRFLSYLCQFGMTPAARGKVSVTGGKKKADPAAAYFG